MASTRETRIRLGAAASLANELVLAALTLAVVGGVVLVSLHGWAYYSTPLRVRGYHPSHSLLKPSGTVAHAFGVCGLLLMSVPLGLYSMRKRWKRLRRAGSLKTWLAVHIYCGVVGAGLVTVHTAMKFNGIVSVAYWSMAIVVTSGFVGRYLYVRIPKSIRGTEMGFGEITERANELRDRLVETGLPAAVLQKLAAFERSVVPDPQALSVTGYVFEQARIRRGVRRLRRELRAAGIDTELATAALSLAAEHASLLGRLAYLHKTKRLFGAWHVLHQPLVYVMFAIAVVHVSLVMYLGYTLF